MREDGHDNSTALFQAVLFTRNARGYNPNHPNKNDRGTLITLITVITVITLITLLGPAEVQEGLLI